MANSPLYVGSNPARGSMTHELQKSEVEICICDACGRDFSIDADAEPIRKMFCLNCLSPYLLEDENEQETSENLW